MAEADILPEPDRIEGAPHPRETETLLGQAGPEHDFLDAFTSGRMHHAWLITGPRGVGKATLAWRIARFLLATPPDDGGMFAPATPDTLDIAPDHPVARRLAALSDPGLFLLRRPYDEKAKRLKGEITVDEARKLKNFFALSASDGGRRVVIIDSADELNTNAANAILKLLEEPPANAILLLISHQPTRLLPTIRSRCRELRLAPLSPPDLAQALVNAGAEPDARAEALAELAAGSVGDALSLTHLEGLKLYSDIAAVFHNAPNYDRQRALKLAEGCAGKANVDRFSLTLRLIDLFLSRLARNGAGLAPTAEAIQGEGALLNRLSSTQQAARAWAATQQSLSAAAQHGRAVNLDPAALILDMVFRINETADAVAAR